MSTPTPGSSQSPASAQPGSGTPSATEKVAARLVELCSAGRYMDAMQELYADDAAHVEVMEVPGSPFQRVTRGKRSLVQKGEWWMDNVTVHSQSVGRPLVNGDQFLIEMTMDCTMNAGPMAGQRMQMAEQCLYTVRDGKISEAKFFYPTKPCE